MSRLSYKWDITHVQRGAVACGDQEPASSGGTAERTSIAPGRGRYCFLPYSALKIQDSAWRHRLEGRPWMDF